MYIRFRLSRAFRRDVTCFISIHDPDGDLLRHLPCRIPHERCGQAEDLFSILVAEANLPTILHRRKAVQMIKVREVLRCIRAFQDDIFLHPGAPDQAGEIGVLKDVMVDNPAFFLLCFYRSRALQAPGKNVLPVPHGKHAGADGSCRRILCFHPGLAFRLGRLARHAVFLVCLRHGLFLHVPPASQLRREGRLPGSFSVGELTKAGGFCGLSCCLPCSGSHGVSITGSMQAFCFCSRHCTFMHDLHCQRIIHFLPGTILILIMDVLQVNGLSDRVILVFEGLGIGCTEGLDLMSLPHLSFYGCCALHSLFVFCSAAFKSFRMILIQMSVSVTHRFFLLL